MDVAGERGRLGGSSRPPAAGGVRVTERHRGPSGFAPTRLASCRLGRRQRVLELLRVLVGQRGLDHGAAVPLERVDGLVGRRLLDDQEQRRGARAGPVSRTCSWNSLSIAFSPRCPTSAPKRGADRQPGERDEEDQAEEEAPEAAPDGSAAGRRASVRRRDVVLAVRVAADRSDLVGLDDEVGFEAGHRLARSFGGVWSG